VNDDFANESNELVVNISNLQSILDDHDRTATYCDNDKYLRSGRSICNRFLIMANLLICSPIIAGILYAIYALGMAMGLTIEQGSYGRHLFIFSSFCFHLGVCSMC